MEKLKSRKLVAWIVWTVIMLILLFGGMLIDKDLPIESALQWYGLVTVTYLGGQAAIDAVGNRRGNQ